MASSGGEAADKFLAGAVGGMVECLVVQPFDMLKTRFQLMPGNTPSLAVAFRDIYREGGVMRFYRGMLPEMSSMVPKNSVMYGTYDFTKEFLEPRLGSSVAVEWLSAAAASGPEAVTVTPFQVVKVRLQAKEHLSRYRGTTHALATILREEGLLTLYTGLNVTFIRNLVWNGVYFPTMFLVKKYIMPETQSGSARATMVTLGSGFCGGTFATCFNNPLDVAKSRIQAPVQGQPLKYTSCFQALLLIKHEEGVGALYKGFKPKVLRMGIGGGVAMAVYELVLESMGHHRKRAL